LVSGAWAGKERGRATTGLLSQRRKLEVNQRLTMIYWRGDRFWLGKLLDHPDIMSQGETLEELEENLRDAYRLMVLDDVPADHQVKELAV
jgi:predicted RNase H-like HicB family nuclease